MKRLLVIEDDADEAHNLVRNMGSLLDVEAIHCPDIEAGLSLAYSWKPDVILLDLGLLTTIPKRTIDFIPDLVKYCPVVVLTGQRGLEADELRILSITKGARNFVQKDHVSGQVGGWQILAAIIRDAFLCERAKTKLKTQPITQ